MPSFPRGSKVGIKKKIYILTKLKLFFFQYLKQIYKTMLHIGDGSTIILNILHKGEKEKEVKNQ